LLTSFQIIGLTVPDPGANQKGPVTVQKQPIATRYRDPTVSLSLAAAEVAIERSSWPQKEQKSVLTPAD